MLEYSFCTLLLSVTVEVIVIVDAQMIDEEFVFTAHLVCTSRTVDEVNTNALL